MNHLVSIVAMMISILGINAITFYYMHTLNTAQLFFLQLTNIVYGVGMSYYAMKFAITQNTATVESSKS